jgi:hypothetical protein
MLRELNAGPKKQQLSKGRDLYTLVEAPLGMETA